MKEASIYFLKKAPLIKANCACDCQNKKEIKKQRNKQRKEKTQMRVFDVLFILRASRSISFFF